MQVNLRYLRTVQVRVDSSIKWEGRNWGHTQGLSLEEFGRKKERDGATCQLQNVFI